MLFLSQLRGDDNLIRDRLYKIGVEQAGETCCDRAYLLPVKICAGVNFTPEVRILER